MFGKKKIKNNPKNNPNLTLDREISEKHILKMLFENVMLLNSLKM